MVDSQNPLPGRSRDIDISKPSSRRPQGPKLNWLWFLIFLLIAAIIFFLGDQGRLGWMPLLIFGLPVVAIACWIAWILVVRRGILTWGRLARAPARALARGDKAGAERALSAALERAHRFSLHDHRRGLMLLELASYVKNQGRYPDAKALFEECIDILGRRWQSNPMDYFIALNNYAVYLIDVCDFMAAQNTLEKVLDLALFWKKGPGAQSVATENSVRLAETCFHLNLVFLFVRMDAPAEARDHLEEADAIVPKLTRQQEATLGDYHRAVAALLLYAEGRFADAAGQLRDVKNQDHLLGLHVRAKLHLVAREFSQAEQVLHKLFDLERDKGSAHRPGLQDHTMDLAESLFGQGKVDDAFAALQKARAIVADFALPTTTAWRQALIRWLQRAQELGRTDAVASLETELQQAPAASDHGITISTRLRVRAL